MTRSRNRNRRGRSVDDLLRWGNEKRVAHHNLRSNNFFKRSKDFVPRINDRSRKIATRRGRSQVHYSLYERGRESSKNMKRVRKDQLSKMFSPVISSKSREIIAKKLGEQEEHARKVDNGKTENLDFYKIITPNECDRSVLIHRDEIRSRGGHGCSNNSDLHSKRCLKIDEKNTVREKKPMDVNPEYISPYTKEILAQNIPMSKITDDVARYNGKIRNSRRKSKKANAEEKPKRLSHSKSKLDLMEDFPLTKEKSDVSRFNKKKLDSLKSTVKKSQERNRRFRRTSKKSDIKKLLYFDDLDASDRSLFAERQNIQFPYSDSLSKVKVDDFEATDVSFTQANEA